MLPENLIKAVADCDGDITLSIRQVLAGYFEEMGGPREFGREMGKMTKDSDMSPNVRASVANSFVRVLSQFGDGDEESTLIDDDQLKRRIQQLDQQP